jgi:hypothetical protein
MSAEDVALGEFDLEIVYTRLKLFLGGNFEELDLLLKNDMSETLHWLYEVLVDEYKDLGLNRIEIESINVDFDFNTADLPEIMSYHCMAALMFWGCLEIEEKDQFSRGYVFAIYTRQILYQTEVKKPISTFCGLTEETDDFDDSFLSSLVGLYANMKDVHDTLPIKQEKKGLQKGAREWLNEINLCGYYFFISMAFVYLIQSNPKLAVLNFGHATRARGIFDNRIETNSFALSRKVQYEKSDNKILQNEARELYFKIKEQIPSQSKESYATQIYHNLIEKHEAKYNQQGKLVTPDDKVLKISIDTIKKAIPKWNDERISP